jgi:hypothetical protein
MISRVTILSLLLALLLAAGIWRWSVVQRDECSAYLAGDKMAPSTMYVVTGTRTVVIPCDDWLERQPGKVQLLCLVDFVLVVMFGLNALQDARGWFVMWRRRRGMIGVR